MIIKEREGIKWIEYGIFQDHPLFRHGSFLRHGGVSEGKYESLNLSRSVGDEPAAVTENQRRVSLQFENRPLIETKQIHGDHVQSVASNSDVLVPGDGLTTSVKGLPLAVHHADCQAAIFFDPVESAFAVVHSGWRGSVKNIYGKTIAHMQKEHGSRPENLLVSISPSLGPNRAEFIHYQQELPESFWAYQVKPLYFDFWAISEAQLMAAGVLQNHIEMARICTYEDEENCYSYRRQGVRGGHGTVAMMASSPR